MQPKSRSSADECAAAQSKDSPAPPASADNTCVMKIPNGSLTPRVSGSGSWLATWGTTRCAWRETWEEQLHAERDLAASRGEPYAQVIDIDPRRDTARLLTVASDCHDDMTGRKAAHVPQRGEGKAPMEPDFEQNMALLRAWRLVGEGRMAEAERRIDEVLARFPDSRLAWLMKSTAQFHRGNFAGGVDSSERAIELDPSDPEGWMSKGLCLAEAGSNEAAIDCYASAIRLDDHHAPAWR